MYDLFVFSKEKREITVIPEQTARISTRLQENHKHNKK